MPATWRSISSSEDWDAVLETNLKGAWLLTQQLAQHWVEKQHPGTVINIASILGIGVSPGVMPYAVSKAGLIQMTKALALEWARYGIRVNAHRAGLFPDRSQPRLPGDARRATAIKKRIPDATLRRSWKTSTVRCSCSRPPLRLT